MKLSKDEARILAEAVRQQKYEMVKDAFKKAPAIFKALKQLEDRLEEFGKDKRRQGRTSQNDWSDCLERYSNK
jgi:hypothetical protein